MDIERAFKFPFQDSAWVTKILIGAVMVLIPILGWLALLGFSMRITRRVAAGADVPLPEWTDFSSLLRDGLKGWGISIIWSVPTIILSALAAASDSFALNCLAWIVSVIVIMFIAAAIVPMAISGNFSDGLQFQQIINRVMSNFTDYLLILVMAVVLQFVAVLGLIACIVGVLATTAYASFVAPHLWAQAHRRATGAGAIAPAPQF